MIGRTRRRLEALGCMLIESKVVDSVEYAVNKDGILIHAGPDGILAVNGEYVEKLAKELVEIKKEWIK